MGRIIDIKSKNMHSSLDYEMSTTKKFLEKLPEVITWLTQRGFRAEVSRYSRYLDYIEAGDWKTAEREPEAAEGDGKAG